MGPPTKKPAIDRQFCLQLSSLLWNLGNSLPEQGTPTMLTTSPTPSTSNSTPILTSTAPSTSDSLNTSDTQQSTTPETSDSSVDHGRVSPGTPAPSDDSAQDKTYTNKDGSSPSSSTCINKTTATAGTPCSPPNKLKRDYDSLEDFGRIPLIHFDSKVTDDVWIPFGIINYEESLPISVKTIVDYMGYVGLLGQMTKLNLMKNIKTSTARQMDQKIICGVKIVLFHIKQIAFERIWKVFKSTKYWEECKVKNATIFGNEAEKFVSIVRGHDAEFIAVSCFLREVEYFWNHAGAVYIDLLKNVIVVTEDGEQKRLGLAELLQPDFIRLSRRVFKRFSEYGQIMLMIAASKRGHGPGIWDEKSNEAKSHGKKE